MPRKSITTISLVATAVIVGGAYWVLSPKEHAAPGAAVQDTSTRTIADQWQWQNFTSNAPAPTVGEGSRVDEPRRTTEVNANAVGIYKILQSMTLDASGRVVPDQTVKEALEEGFETLGPGLSSRAMFELQASIRTGLPGQAGEDVARMFDDYYRFRLAELEFNEQPIDQSPADRYEKLAELRRSYLGAETADRLFAAEDANGRHMLASIAIQTNVSLTDAEKDVQQAALQEKLSDRLLTLGLMKPEEAEIVEDLINLEIG